MEITHRLKLFVLKLTSQKIESKVQSRQPPLQLWTTSLPLYAISLNEISPATQRKGHEAGRKTSWEDERFPWKEQECKSGQGVGAHRREPASPWLKVRKFELASALLKLLTTGVSMNKRSWPRVWLISILSVEVGLLHLAVPIPAKETGWKFQEVVSWRTLGLWLLSC